MFQQIIQSSISSGTFQKITIYCRSSILQVINNPILYLVIVIDTFEKLKPSQLPALQVKIYDNYFLNILYKCINQLFYDTPINLVLMLSLVSSFFIQRTSKSFCYIDLSVYMVKDFIRIVFQPYKNWGFKTTMESSFSNEESSTFGKFIAKKICLNSSIDIC